MTLTWSLLVALLAGAGVIWFWLDSLGVRERANRAAMEACQQLQLQFLDGTVAFARLWPTRGPGGRLTLRRTYVFDYTADSIERRQGFVVLLGPRVESVGFATATGTRTAAPTATGTAPPRIVPTQTGIATPEPPAQPVAKGHAEWGNVYDLESWRAARRRDRPPASGGDG